MICKELTVISTGFESALTANWALRFTTFGQNRAKQLRDLFYIMHDSLEILIKPVYTNKFDFDGDLPGH